VSGKCQGILVDLTFCVYFLYLFGQENLIFIREKSGKSQGILKSEAYDNHVTFGNVYRNTNCLGWNSDFTN